MATVVRCFSTESLPDPSTYYSGHKKPLVLAWSDATRTLCDENGQWEASRMTVEVSDFDGTLRDLEESRSQVGTAFSLRWISDTGRAAQATARDLFSGQVLQIQQAGDYRLRLSVRDGVAWMITSVTGDERLFPSREINPQDFPTCPAENQGKPVPVFFGYISDAASDETAATGLVQPIYVGTRTLLDGLSWHEWVVAGHACDRITAVVIGSGDDRSVLVSGGPSWSGTWLAAKESGWTTKVDPTNYYRRYNGRDYCCLYGRGVVPDACAAGESRLGVNLKGWTRDGIGGDYIYDLYEAWLVFLVNYVCGEIIAPTGDSLYATVREWQAGALLPMPTINSIAMVDAQSWYTAKNAADARVSGGYRAFVALDAQRPIRDILADFARSAGCRYGVNGAGQYICYGVPDMAATVAVTTTTDILRGTFEPTIANPRDKRNGVLVKVARLPKGTSTSQSYAGSEDVGSGAQSTLELPFLPSTDSDTITDGAVDVATRWLLLTGARRIKFRTTPCVGTQLELGTIFTCDHDAGWPGRLWQVETWAVSPDDYSVEITAVDVSALQSARSVLRTGSATMTGLGPRIGGAAGVGAGTAALTGATPTVTEATP